MILVDALIKTCATISPFYDKQVATKAADFMSKLSLDKVQVQKSLSGKKHDELYDKLNGEIRKHLTNKVSKDT